MADGKSITEKVKEKLKISDDPELDIFRDTYVRYLGYSNEIGEAFRPLVSRTFVNSTYVLATGYVLADTYTKAASVYKVKLKESMHR